MSDVAHSRDCVLPSDGRAEGLVRASELFALTAARDRLTAEVERLRAALEFYADTFCEGPAGPLCGKLDDTRCSGCKARAALSGDKQ